MNKNIRAIRRKRLFLLFLAIVFIFSAGAIALAVTIFYPQIPLFRLLENQDALTSRTIVPPKPGVQAIIPEPSTQLFLILGSDVRPQAGFRTDVILLVMVNAITRKVSLISFPRDLWVNIPGLGEGRINTVMQLGGFPLLLDTFQHNFGLYPTEYAMVDMDGFLAIVDALGGVAVQTDLVTSDACDSALDPDRWCDVGPGEITLDSDWALWYVRARYNSSDFDRMRRTQEVFTAIFEKIVHMRGIIKIPALLQIYDEQVETNISTAAMIPLISMALDLDGESNVQRFSIGPNEVTNIVTDQGAQVLLPDVVAIQFVLLEALAWVHP